MKPLLVILLLNVAIGNGFAQSVTLHNSQIGIIQTNKGSGSGFAFVKKNLVFTAAHVVYKTRNIEYDAIYVRGNKALAPNYRHLKILAIDSVYDFAILKSNESITTDYFSPSDLFDVRTGDLVFYTGFDTAQTIKTGNPSMKASWAHVLRVDSFWSEHRLVKVFEFYGEGVPGYSGGPIINMNGKVVGFMKAYRIVNNQIIDVAYSIIPSMNKIKRNPKDLSIISHPPSSTNTHPQK